MIIKFNFKIIKKISNFIIIFFIITNNLMISKLNANSFNINEVEVSEDFNLDFNKKKVFDKAFESAFFQLISTVIISEDVEKVEKASLSTIKSLIDSFNVSDERFFKNRYYAKFNVNFNKKNSYKYFESKNIFPSSPKKLDLFFLPILINSSKNQLVYLAKNPIYNNWNNLIANYHLLNYILPTEDIEDIQVFNNNTQIIEDYNFDKIAGKYDLKDYLVLIIYQNENKINILSKLKFKNSNKIINLNYNNINLDDKELITQLIFDLKKIYEDEWKKINLINTSIQLPLTISIPSKNFDTIKLFEKKLADLDFVSNYSVLSFNSNDILYKVIYNGHPNKFFNEIKSSSLTLEQSNQIWKIK